MFLTIKQEKMKLNAQIAAAYFGCTVKYKKWECPMHSISSDYMDLEDNLGDYHTGVPYSDCQLLLTPLSEISDEDAIEVAKILIPQCFLNTKKGWNVSRDYAVTGYPYVKIYNPKKVYSVQIDCTLVNFDVDDMEDRVTASCDAKPASIIDYLRASEWNGKPKQAYDCGFMEIKSLIEAGIAIKK